MKNATFALLMGLFSATNSQAAETPLWLCVENITQPRSERWKAMNDLGSGERLLLTYDSKSKYYLVYQYAAKSKAQVDEKSMAKNKKSCSLNVGTKSASAPGVMPIVFGDQSKSGAWSLEISSTIKSYAGESSYQKATFKRKDNWKSFETQLYCVSALD